MTLGEISRQWISRQEEMTGRKLTAGRNFNLLVTAVSEILLLRLSLEFDPIKHQNFTMDLRNYVIGHKQ